MSHEIAQLICLKKQLRIKKLRLSPMLRKLRQLFIVRIYRNTDNTNSKALTFKQILKVFKSLVYRHSTLEVLAVISETCNFQAFTFIVASFAVRQKMSLGRTKI